MASKRFTDIKKWRNEWFRTLPIKAKLTWVYLCDECEMEGVWKADYGLASFQLGFPVNAEFIEEWFQEKVFFLSADRILIVQFFEFQYGESKDTWAAKIRAKEKLEALGFTIQDNKLILPTDSPPTVPPLSCDSPPTRLIRVRGRVSNSVFKKSDFEKVYDAYPRKIGKGKGLDQCVLQIKTQEDFDALMIAVSRYRDSVTAKGTEEKYIKHFSTFMSEWKDWTDPTTGTVNLPSQPPKESFEEYMKRREREAQERRAVPSGA